MGNSQKDEDWKQTQFFHSVLNIEKQECTHKQTKPCMTQGCILHQDGRNVVTKMSGWNKKSFSMGDKPEYIYIPQLPFNYQKGNRSASLKGEFKLLVTRTSLLAEKLHSASYVSNERTMQKCPEKCVQYSRYWGGLARGNQSQRSQVTVEFGEKY